MMCCFPQRHASLTYRDEELGERARCLSLSTSRLAVIAPLSGPLSFSSACPKYLQLFGR